jgi:toxin-antitoxin system PIN domain toxin
LSRTHLCDLNVWLALTISGHQKHVDAARRLDGLPARDSVLFCRTTQQSFLRLLTAAAVFAPYGNAPLSNRAAWRVYRALAADDRTQLAAEPSELQDVWEGYAERDTASPKLWTDAYLAAFARTGGHRLVTTDQDYGQFPDLDVLVL